MNKTDIEIPEVINEKLSKHSKQFGIELDELKTELIEYLPQVKKEYPKADIKKQIGLAYRNLATRLAQEEGSTRSNAVIHTAFFIGETGIKDATESMRRKILRMSPAEQQTYHPDENTWLDYRQDKDTHLEPLKPLDHRTLYGIGSSGNGIDKDRLQFVKLDLWRDIVRHVAPEFNTPYKFRAVPRETDQQLGFYDLSGTQFTRLRHAPERTEEEKENDIRNCGKDVFGIDDIDMLYKTRFTGDQSFNADPVFIEAYVSRVILREEKSNVVTIYDDTENGMLFATGYVPHYLPINFKENDRVIFLAELGELTRQNEEKSTVMFIKGYFVVPNTAEDYI